MPKQNNILNVSVKVNDLFHTYLELLIVFYINFIFLIFLPTVPAKISEEFSSKNMKIEEGSSVDIFCNVTGVPEPSVMWFRKSKYLPPDGISEFLNIVMFLF